MLENYIPSDESINIRYKLQVACQEPLNKPMNFCKNLQTSLYKGTMFYRNARTIFGNFMQTTYHSYNGHYLGMEGAVFTEPLSEEYCIQWFSLNQLAPIQHPDARYDIKKILKLRVSADSNLCVLYHYYAAANPVNEFLPKAENDHMMVEKLSFFWTAENISHPIYAYYNETAKIVEEQIKNNVTVNFIAAAIEGHKKLTRPLLMNDTNVIMPNTRAYADANLAMETTRLVLAEKMLSRINNASNLTPMQALVITARTDINSAINIDEAFERGHLNLHTSTRSIYHTFESLTEVDKDILYSLSDYHHLTIADSLKYLTYLKDFSLEQYYVVQQDHSLRHFKNNLTALQTCSPYNASSIINSVAAGFFGHVLKENLQPCRALAKELAHPGFHLHNFFPDDYHSQAHQLEDALRADETMMRIVMFMMFLLTVAAMYGTAKLAYKPLKKCTARLFSKNKKSYAANDEPFSPEHRLLIMKETSTTTSKTFWWKSGDIERETMQKNVKQVYIKKM